MKKISKICLILGVVLIFSASTSLAFEETKTITIPAESPEGVTVDLEKGEYVVEFEAGAISLFYPINPNCCWLIAVAVGIDVEGGQDDPNLGTLYFEPSLPVYTQLEAEQLAQEAVGETIEGTYLEFALEEDKEVRFWVSDFDYTDNSGMIKLKIRSISE